MSSILCTGQCLTLSQLYDLELSIYLRGLRSCHISCSRQWDNRMSYLAIRDSRFSTKHHFYDAV
jgi:hypothetical protein